MDKQALVSRLQTLLSPKRLLLGEPMSRHTTLHLGGPADVLAMPRTAQEISRVLLAARECGVPVTVIGNGSNVLVRDGGIRGLVLLIADGFDAVRGPVPVGGERFALTAQGGALLTKLSNAAASAALSGMEFAAGIPGTVGGAVYMNAGAYGGEMKDVVSQVMVCGMDGRFATYMNEEMQFGYRQSLLSRQPKGVVTSVTVLLYQGDEDMIRTSMREFNARRREKQPVNLPSCGSTFKRPQGHFAAALIEQCGLKGLRVGGASVSALHAGFLVNDAQGTAADYLSLMAQVTRIVWEKTGVQLEPEVRILGEAVDEGGTQA